MRLTVLSLLGIIFVHLKLSGVIAWSWWWVTLPFWGGIALVCSIPLLGIIIGSVILGVAAFVDWFRK